MLKAFKIIWQISLIFIFSFLGNCVTSGLKLNLPGTIPGIAFLFILLKFKIIRLEWVETGANWLLAQLLLFFIPSAVGLIQYKTLFVSKGISLVIVIVISTGLVMAISAMLTEKIVQRKKELNT